MVISTRLLPKMSLFSRLVGIRHDVWLSQDHAPGSRLAADPFLFLFSSEFATPKGKPVFLYAENRLDGVSWMKAIKEASYEYLRGVLLDLQQELRLKTGKVGQPEADSAGGVLLRCQPDADRPLCVAPKDPLANSCEGTTTPQIPSAELESAAATFARERQLHAASVCGVGCWEWLGFVCVTAHDLGVTHAQLDECTPLQIQSKWIKASKHTRWSCRHFPVSAPWGQRRSGEQRLRAFLGGGRGACCSLSLVRGVAGA